VTGKSLIHAARSCSLGADRRWLGIEGALVGGHKLGRPRKAGQGRLLETSAAEVKPRSTMPVDEAVHVFRQMAHHTRSHSFASIVSPDRSVGSAVMITIFPVLSISIRAICTPAALTALTALVTSCCRNVEGARDMARATPWSEWSERSERWSASRHAPPFRPF